jgi:hypothetical protein
MNFEKENFLRTRLVRHFQQLEPSRKPLWGKMNVHQMIEHFTEDALRVANGRNKFEEIITPANLLQPYRDFLMSDRPFKENTINPLLPSEPVNSQYNTIQAAIGALQLELIHFFDVFAKNPQLETRNPIFGDLGFDQNVQLIFKHAVHHLRQFGVNVLL